MPLISFVLVVHGEQAYVEECAAAILAPEFDDLELVAVAAEATGHAPALLAELAERDPRVRIGPAEAATGDYVWFIHPTDLVGPLTPLAERLANDRPDALVVHHASEDVLGNVTPGPLRKELQRAAKQGPGPLAKRQQLADATREPRTIIARRELGHDGTLAGAWRALLAAERVAAHPGRALERRVRPNAPAPQPDVLAEYERVLAATDRRDLVAAPMLRHLLALLDDAPDRRDFFHRMARLYKQAGAPRRGRVSQLVAGDHYAAYRLWQRAREARARRGEDPGAKLERHYESVRRKPIEPTLAVFAAYWFRGYSCNPRAIYEKARELVPDMRGVWVVRREGVDALPAGVEHVVAGTAEYYEAIARARYLVNNVNFPNHLVKRDGQTHVMTHHGTPLKTMGLDQRNAPFSGRRIDFEALLRRCARWDFSISSNAFSTLVWERAYPLPYETLETGYPRNDVLATATDEDVQRARAELGIEPGQTAVLYAPTHREYEPSFVPKLDLAALAEALGPDHVVLARLHYFYEGDPALRELAAAGRIRDVADHDSVEQLQLAADALVTDYSSIMFDYAVLDRPIVIHAPDWEIYRTLRGTYFDLMAEPPGRVARTDKEVVEAITGGDGEPGRRAGFRARFCALDDGRAAERVVRRVWFGEREPAERPQPAVVG